jgi:hypothetical protein
MTEIDDSLRAAVREIETHAAESGWEQPARLFALVPTADLLAREPSLAATLGVETAVPGSLTPVEQDAVPADRPLEETLQRIIWPAEVFGCAAVVERLVLPPEAEDALPDEPAAAEEYVGEHPDREEVRIVAAATRDGTTYCALRIRTHDDPDTVLEGPDLVPALLELLSGTLDQ